MQKITLAFINLVHLYNIHSSFIQNNGMGSRRMNYAFFDSEYTLSAELTSQTELYL